MSRPHPMQDIVIDERGVVRFRSNRLIVHLFESGMADLNRLAGVKASAADRMQLAQLVGYSVSGFGSLSFTSEAARTQADAIAATVLQAHQLCADFEQNLQAGARQ